MYVAFNLLVLEFIHESKLLEYHILIEYKDYKDIN